MFKDEYTEECKITNLESLDPELSSKEVAETYTIHDLWKLIQTEEEHDDGFGVGDTKKNKKKNVEIGKCKSKF